MSVFHCDKCGWESRPPPHVAQVWHPCRPAQRRRRLVFLPSIEGTTREEARADAWAALFGSALSHQREEEE